MFGRDKFGKFAEGRFAESQFTEGRPESRQEGRCGHHREERHHGRYGREMFEGFMGRHGRGFGGDRERLFDSGELRLVILQLVAEKPSYGYEIIKAIEERLSGGYAPSPGVVYPTLTLLEEEGYATSSAEGNKKLYTVTELGTEYLKTNKATIKAIFGRMEQASDVFGRGRSPQIMRAFMNLKFAMKMRAAQGDLTPEQTRKIAEAIDAAARVIGEV
ncbi:PadR family transcriptional regulator [Acidicapsa acidisoli]|uniref:PadR family transcriptional regulator n=1 Tax=Acidicapsa acidisoli TaxID=1615681 RepID=UPI0021E0F6DF|nr:PadR family transcriptional regulator [Acidicapsa acidisoli]